LLTILAVVVAVWYNSHRGDEMANVQKYTRADVNGGSLTRHYERAKDEDGQYHKWGNQEIDPSRSHLNYNLAPDREKDQLAFIADRLSEVKCHKRADVNIMCSWVITAPKGLEDNEHERFFQQSFDFLCDKYGEKNVVSAWVHMDETSPHLHFAFVPVVTDKKKGHEKVSAKEALGWSEKGLHKFHREFDAHMTTVFGRDVGVLNEATKDGNKEIWELKKETAIAEAKAALEAEIRPIEGKIAHESRINRLEDGIKEKKSLFGDKSTIVITAENMTAEEAKTVLNAARDRDKMRLRRDSSIKERDEAVSAKNIAENDKNKAISKLQGIEQREAAVKTAQKEAQMKQSQADTMYQQQLNLNQLHTQAMRERDGYKTQLEAEKQKTDIIASENAILRSRLNHSQQAMTDIVKAVGMLKYDKNINGYKTLSLTKKQDRLIDGIANYGSKIARAAGRTDLAKDIDESVSINQGITTEIRALEPKQNLGWER